MALPEILVLLLVAGVCGALGQSLGGYSRGGCLVAIALGFVGAVLGRWLASEFNLPPIFTITVGGKVFPIVWSIIGATLFVALLGLLSKSRRRSE